MGSPKKAFAAGVAPFVIIDIIKVSIAAVLANKIKKIRI